MELRAARVEPLTRRLKPWFWLVCSVEVGTGPVLEGGKGMTECGGKSEERWGA